MSKTYIIVKTQFEAMHHWPDVPEELKEVQFLKDPHLILAIRYYGIQ